MEKRYLLTIEYDGTNYVGWQRQKNGLSVQEACENAWQSFFKEKISVEASGRTDAGVHALAQTAHFDTKQELTPKKIVTIFNTALPKDIAVKACRQVKSDFNARFLAKRKTYEYRIYNGRIKSAFQPSRAAYIKQPLDAHKMRAAAKFFRGTHDFSAFMAVGSKIKDFTRTIYDISVSDDIETEMITIEVTGNGFLYNMVRIIAGTLVYVGLGKLSAEDVPAIIASHDRKCAGKTLPAEGLYLVKVEYE